MFSFFKRRQRRKDEGWTVWIAEPSRRNLRVVRRWGVITNTKVSNYQFNVYEDGPMFVVTMHSSDGKEVEHDNTGLFKGGRCASIDEAWEAAASYMSDMLSASGMMGLPCHAMVVLETTPDIEPFHLSTFEYANGAVQETRHFDPNTRQPL